MLTAHSISVRSYRVILPPAPSESSVPLVGAEVDSGAAQGFALLSQQYAEETQRLAYRHHLLSMEWHSIAQAHQAARQQRRMARKAPTQKSEEPTEVVQASAVHKLAPSLEMKVALAEKPQPRVKSSPHLKLAMNLEPLASMNTQTDHSVDYQGLLKSLAIGEAPQIEELQPPLVEAAPPAAEPEQQQIAEIPAAPAESVTAIQTVTEVHGTPSASKDALNTQPEHPVMNTQEYVAPQYEEARVDYGKAVAENIQNSAPTIIEAGNVVAGASASEESATIPMVVSATPTISYPIVMGLIGPPAPAAAVAAAGAAAPPPAAPTPTVDVAQQKTTEPSEEDQTILGLDGGTPSPRKTTPAVEVQPLPVDGFSATISEAFSGGSSAISGASAQVLGSQQVVRSDGRGQAHFKETGLTGVLPVIIRKEGYLWRRADLQPNREMFVELVSENAARMAALASGDAPRGDSAFMFIQLVDPEGKNLSGYTARIISAASRDAGISPRYVDENGAPLKAGSATSSRGQLIFPAAPQGDYILVVTDAAGRDRAPHLMHVGAGEGIVRKVSLGRAVGIQGRILNGQLANAPFAGATVLLFGTDESAATATADKNGRFKFSGLYVDCDDLNYLQVEREGIYRNRLEYSCGGSDYYVMPKTRVDSLAEEAGMGLNPNAGIIIGHVSMAFSTKVQLIGPQELVPAENPRGYDFYFERDGIINPGRDRTSRSGNFILMDAPGEMSYMQVFDRANSTTRHITPIFTAPSTVSVIVR